MDAVVIAVSQGKGGAAKTTTSVNLAGALNELGVNTILFDWDLDKPDSIKWMEQGSFINWIKEINKDNPMSDIELVKKKYDVIIFDTPPNYAPNAFKAIMASDYVIIPTTGNFLDQENAKNAISIPMLAKKPFKIIMSKIKKGTKEGKDIQSHIGEQDISFREIITERNVIAQCPSKGQWIGQYAKGSDSHIQFLNFAKEVIQWAGISYQKENKIVEEVVA